MIKSVITNTDECFNTDETVIKGITILTVSLNTDGISANISGHVTPDLLKALRRDVPKAIDKLIKEIK
jgi:hypothetical protein